MSSKNARAELARIISAIPKLEDNLRILRDASSSNTDKEDAISQRIEEARAALDYARRVSAASQVDALLGKVTEAGVSVPDAEKAVERAEDELFQVQALQCEIKSRIAQTERELSAMAGSAKPAVGKVLLESGFIAQHMETIERAEADFLKSHEALEHLIASGYLVFADIAEHGWSGKVHRHRTAPGMWQQSLTTKRHDLEKDMSVAALAEALRRDAQAPVHGEAKTKGK